MRHRVAGRRLSRTSEHRVALRRNLAQSLIEHETISTTIQKAKEVKPFVERLITLAKKGKLQHRRRAIALVGNRDIYAYEDGEPVKKGTVIGKLFSELGPRYLDRPGGYTRIIRLSLRRLGDNGELVLLQLLGEDEPVKREKKSTKRRARKKRKETVAAAGESQAVEVADEQEAVVPEPKDAEEQDKQEAEDAAPADATEAGEQADEEQGETDEGAEKKE
jgi:large subunit ribosomal protein L17